MRLLGRRRSSSREPLADVEGEAPLPTLEIRRLGGPTCKCEPHLGGLLRNSSEFRRLLVGQDLCRVRGLPNVDEDGGEGCREGDRQGAHPLPARLLLAPFTDVAATR